MLIILAALISLLMLMVVVPAIIMAGRIDEYENKLEGEGHDD